MIFPHILRPPKLALALSVAAKEGSLMIQGLEDDHNDMVATLKACNYEGFFKALLHTAGREFLSEINTLSSTTISNALSNFNGTYIPNPMVDNVDYLLKQVPVNELAAWFNSQAYNYSTAAGSLANDVIARALTARFQDCDFRTCLTEEWIDTNITIQFDSLIDWYKENYWTNILAETYSCSADSFTYFTSYNQRTIIAEILDDWHLPMKDFMTEIQTHYGSGIKNWLNLDTLRQYQYAKLNELHIYGSSRLGVLSVSDTVHGGIRLYNFDLSTGDTSLTYDMAYEDFYTFDSAYKLYRGDKSYEGSNHLGNVLVVFSDKRIPLCSSGTVYKYQADLKQAMHYSAFGAPLPDLRWYANSSSQYDFGFNGKIEDDEVNADGNHLNFGARVYDPRLGKWFSIDPLSNKYPALSPYNYCALNPIFLIDRDGKRIFIHYVNSEGKSVVYEYRSGMPLPNDEYVRKTVMTLDHIALHETTEVSPDGRALIRIFSRPGRDINILNTPRLDATATITKPETNEINIYWNPNLGSICSDPYGTPTGGAQSPATVLAHELSHTYNLLATTDDFNTRKGTRNPRYSNDEEKFVIEGFESSFSRYFKEGVRLYHAGVEFHVVTPTSIQPAVTPPPSPEDNAPAVLLKSSKQLSVF